MILEYCLLFRIQDIQLIGIWFEEVYSWSTASCRFIFDGRSGINVFIQLSARKRISMFHKIKLNCSFNVHPAEWIMQIISNRVKNLKIKWEFVKSLLWNGRGYNKLRPRDWLDVEWIHFDGQSWSKPATSLADGEPSRQKVKGGGLSSLSHLPFHHRSTENQWWFKRKKSPMRQGYFGWKWGKKQLVGNKDGSRTGGGEGGEKKAPVGQKKKKSFE